MALFKPEMTTTSGFSGICECNIVKIVDKSDLFDWADIYLEVQLLQNGSKYTRSANILGEFEKDAKGVITGGSVIKRMYTFFAAIGCDAGINLKGEWEDSIGNKIDIIEYLEPYLAIIDGKNWDGESLGKDGKYLAYFYKQQPKKPGDKAYGRAHYKLYPVSETNKVKLQSDIDWMKSKGYIKEAIETETVMTVDADDLGSLALDNL